MDTGPNTRAAAATALAETVGRHAKIDEALARALNEVTDPRDRAFVQELCYGTLRWYFRLDYIAGLLLSRPLRQRDEDVRALLLCGLYQLEQMRVPDHAAVSATVEAARLLGKPWGAAVINAVLRRYQREKISLTDSATQYAAAHYAHPGWLIESLQYDWPEHWQSILEAGNERPPLHLRVNPRRVSRNQYLQELRGAGWRSGAAEMADSGVWLEGAAGVEQIPGFAEGHVSVQDFGAQLAAPLLAARAGERVLDACAAPGGKTAHILERTADLGCLVALDRAADRLEKLNSNLDRLALEATVIQGDASRPDDWWDRQFFDRILLDAPCSATGVIRRHPDIKIRRRPGQLPEFAAVQSRLLDALWPLVAAGGHLLYSTCSVLRLENDAVIEDFMNNHEDAHSVQIHADWGTPAGPGRQILPGQENTDGFYYAILGKR